ncbi:MAG: radical SAM protein [Nanoarchaeota archaeon]|nr:radical SAM protein [Nanoarchaeota archaeon]
MKIKHDKEYAIKKIANILVKSLPNLSNKNMLRLINLLQVFKVRGEYKTANTALQGLKKMLEKNHPNLGIIRNLSNYLSDNCKKKLLENFILNSAFFSREKKNAFAKKHGFFPPFFFVISPTMKCNLNCEGCYASKYDKNELSFQLIDRIFNEAKDMGTYFITVSGGEPFLRKDLLDLFEKHNDMYFQVYTNGTLIDEKIAKKLSELGNVAIALSLEGFKKETDARRGKGTFDKVLNAIENLRKEGVLFGLSAVPTRHNAEVLCSERFIDFLLEQGFYFGWYFQYIPIGKKPDVKLMMTPEQRNRFRIKLSEVRSRKRIFLTDFWNDGPYVKGCMAGGKHYFHINSNGDVEPCVFVHYAVDNIKEKSLTEVLSSGFFREIRKHQPISENHLKPCMIIDNPNVLRKICKNHKPKPTHAGSRITEDKKITRFLDGYSRKFKDIVDPIWEKEYSKWYKHWFHNNKSGGE